MIGISGVSIKDSYHAFDWSKLKKMTRSSSHQRSTNSQHSHYSHQSPVEIIANEHASASMKRKEKTVARINCWILFSLSNEQRSNETFISLRTKSGQKIEHNKKKCLVLSKYTRNEICWFASEYLQQQPVRCLMNTWTELWKSSKWVRCLLGFWR